MMNLKEYFRRGSELLDLNLHHDVKLQPYKDASLVVPIQLVSSDGTVKFNIFYSHQYSDDLLRFLSMNGYNYSFMDDELPSEFDPEEFKHLLEDWGLGDHGQRA